MLTGNAYVIVTTAVSTVLTIEESVHPHVVAVLDH